MLHLTCTGKERVAPFRKISASNEKLLGEAFRKLLLLELLEALSDKPAFFFLKKTFVKKLKIKTCNVAREILWEENRCSMSNSENFWCLVSMKSHELTFRALEIY